MVVHPANITDRTGGERLVNPVFQEAFPTVEVVLADRGYRGSFVKHVQANCPGLRAEIVEHDDAGVGEVWVKPGQEVPKKKAGFRVLRLRWVVERTFAWIGLNRRMAKDYEATIASSETWIWMAMASILVKRLAG